MTKTQTTNLQEDVIDIDLSVTKKKKFRFDKDDNRVVYINTSDVNIVQRIPEAYEKLVACQELANKLMDGINPSPNDDLDDILKDFDTMGERLKAIDQEMRDIIDYMFNAKVSEVAAPDGSMYDPFDGAFRYSYILTLIISQFEENITNEFGKVEKQFKKHTAKYTKGK